LNSFTVLAVIIARASSSVMTGMERSSSKVAMLGFNFLGSLFPIKMEIVKKGKKSFSIFDFAFIH